MGYFVRDLKGVKTQLYLGYSFWKTSFFLQNRVDSVLGTDSFRNLFNPINGYSFGVLGIFHWHNSSGRTMALGSTQPLTEMSIMNIFWEVKAAR